MKSLIASAAIALTLPFATYADNAQNKAMVLEALNTVLFAGNVEAVEKYFSSNYIQHNQDIADGIEAQKELVGLIAQSDSFKVEIARVIADDDMVVVHGRYEGIGPTPAIAFDVFRVEDGKIAEHWDNLVPEAEPNSSGNTQIDGATDITDLDATDENKALVLEMQTRVFIDRDDVDLSKYFSPVTYINHNTKAGDGLDVLEGMFKMVAEKGITLKYHKIHQVIGEGNFVLTMADGQIGKHHNAIFDLFRLEDGLIVEHWDIVVPMPGLGAKYNESGKF